MRTLTVGVLACLIVLAGCSGLPGRPAPPSGETTVAPAAPDAPYVAFVNDDTRTYELTVYVTAEGIDDYRVTFRNGTTQTVGQNDVPYGAVGIEPAGEVLASESYTVEPATNLFVSLTGCRETSDVVIVLWPAGSPEGFSFGPAFDCPDLTLLEERNQQGGGVRYGDDYRYILEDSNTVRRTLAAT